MKYNTLSDEVAYVKSIPVKTKDKLLKEPLQFLRNDTFKDFFRVDRALNSITQKILQDLTIKKSTLIETSDIKHMLDRLNNNPKYMSINKETLIHDSHANTLMSYVKSINSLILSKSIQGSFKYSNVIVTLDTDKIRIHTDINKIPVIIKLMPFCATSNETIQVELHFNATIETIQQYYKQQGIDLHWDPSSYCYCDGVPSLMKAQLLES